MEDIEKLKLILKAIRENKNAATYLPEGDKIDEIKGFFIL